MKNQIAVLAFSALVFILPLVYGEEPKVSEFELWGGIAGGSVLSGMQVDLAKASLSPSPESLSHFAPFVGVSYFPADNLGLEAFYCFLGTTSSKKSGMTDLKTYETSSINLGVNLRYAFSIDAKNSCAISFAGGASYSFFDYAADYKALFGGFQFYKVDPGLGWYAKLAGNVYHDWFLVGLGGMYAVQNPKVQVTNKLLDGAYASFLLHFGVFLPK